MADSAQNRCRVFHDWGIEAGYRVTDDLKLERIWWRGVPDSWVGSAEGGVGRPGEKVCGRCGKRKPLRWRVGLR